MDFNLRWFFNLKIYIYSFKSYFIQNYKIRFKVSSNKYTKYEMKDKNTVKILKEKTMVLQMLRKKFNIN